MNAELEGFLERLAGELRARSLQMMSAEMAWAQVTTSISLDAIADSIDAALHPNQDTKAEE